MDRIEEIIGKMTLEDKVAFCTGKDFWQTKDYEKYGIPSIFMCDGPLGVRKQMDKSDMLGVNKSYPSTCFPAEVTTAGSWDTELLNEIGKALGEECKDQGVAMLLGPGANMKRNPLCGRNFEYFSEDPYLAGKLAASEIRAIEGEGIATSLKHFAANSQELCRFTSDGIIDERTLRELYLPAFEIAVKEGKPSTVMCSYPKINGVFSSDNKELLTDILREQWGFDGMVVTDWGAMNNRIEGFRAGCDLNMPGGSAYMEKDVVKAVREGKLPESVINDSVRRILKVVFNAQKTVQAACDYERHHNLARRAAEEGAVLLRNENDTLPLKDGASIAVIGSMAKKMRYQGAGSSHINPTKVINPMDCAPDALYATGCTDFGDTTDELLKEAAETARKANVAIVFAGLPDRYESEGFDRPDMRLPEGHNRMIEAVLEANPNTVVVIFAGSAVECPWADQAKAILYMGLPGQAGGEAVWNILTGRVNPSGRLAESWPYSYEDVPSSGIYCKTRDALYEEGLYIGYRYYDKAKKDVRWGFGHGLSYTTFSYSDLSIEGRKVSVKVTNTGSRAGSEVVQLYVRAPQGGIHRPVRELRAFAKVHLKAGESKSVSFELDDRAFSIWNEGWVIVGGTYAIEIGPLSCQLDIQGSTIPAPQWQEGSFYEGCQGKPSLNDLESVMGRKYEAPVLKKGHFTMENTVEEMKDHSLIMKIMYKATEKVIAKGFGGKIDYNNPDFKMLMASSAGSPLRSMQISGGLSDSIMQGLLAMANGHFFKGILRMMGLGR